MGGLRLSEAGLDQAIAKVDVREGRRFRRHARTHRCGLLSVATFERRSDAGRLFGERLESLGLEEPTELGSVIDQRTAQAIGRMRMVQIGGVAIDLQAWRAR